MFDIRKMLKSAFLFLAFYLLAVLILASDLVGQSLPNAYLFEMGIFVVSVVLLLYILPVTLKSYVLSLHGIKHKVEADGCVRLPQISDDKKPLLLTKYIYYIFITVISLLGLKYLTGLQALLMRTSAGLGSLLAFIELMPTTHNQVKRFSKTYRKTYITLVVLTGVLLLTMIKYYWF